MESKINELHHKGIAAFNDSRFEEAIKLFSIIIDEIPNYDRSLNNRAIAYRQLGQYEKALNDVSLAVILNSGELIYYSNQLFPHSYYHIRSLD
ncbi:MAG: hypothetical protein ACK5OS_05440 [Chryseotalea sp.]